MISVSVETLLSITLSQSTNLLQLNMCEPPTVLQKVFSVYSLFPTLTINMLQCHGLEAAPRLLCEPLMK